MKSWTRNRNIVSTRFAVDPAGREDFLRTFEEMCDTTEPFYQRSGAFASKGGQEKSWCSLPGDEDVVRELRAEPEFKRLTAALLDCCNGPMIMEQFSGMDIDRGVFDDYPAGSSVVHQAGSAHEVVFK